MADEPKKFDFTASIKKLEEINAWFQDDDFNLDEGLQKLKEGKELIKNCRARLRQVENEFIQIKHEFSEEVRQEPAYDGSKQVLNGQKSKPTSSEGEEPSPDEIPF